MKGIKQAAKYHTNPNMSAAAKAFHSPPVYGLPIDPATHTSLGNPFAKQYLMGNLFLSQVLWSFVQKGQRTPGAVAN